MNLPLITRAKYNQTSLEEVRGSPTKNLKKSAIKGSILLNIGSSNTHNQSPWEKSLPLLIKKEG